MSNIGTELSKKTCFQEEYIYIYILYWVYIIYGYCRYLSTLHHTSLWLHTNELNYRLLTASHVGALIYFGMKLLSEHHMEKETSYPRHWSGTWQIGTSTVPSPKVLPIGNSCRMAEFSRRIWLEEGTAWSQFYRVSETMIFEQNS